MNLFRYCHSSLITTKLPLFVHISTSSTSMVASKSNLAKLRKKTGYPFGNCKKALEVSNNDLAKAEQWLEEQAKALGWSKAAKMESRNTPQGLIGVACDKQYAAMVEVNCETDFVAKNEKFQKLVDIIAKTCLHHVKSETIKPGSILKSVLEGGQIGQLLAADQQSLSDHVVRSVGLVGEKLVVRRAALLGVTEPMQLAAHTHPATTAANETTLMGKYGAVLVYSTSAPGDRTEHLSKQLCQHVIGMNPIKIDSSPNDPVEVVKEKPAVPPPATGVEGEEVEEREAGDGGDTDETVMMRQTFLLDPDRTVAEVVGEAGIVVDDFVRFECGEPIKEQEEEAARAAQVGG